MPVTNKIVSLKWNVPTRILEENKKRIYVRFYIEGEYFYLGGPEVTNSNGIQVSWKNDQDMQSPESEFEYWAVGQCKLRVMEVINEVTSV